MPPRRAPQPPTEDESYKLATIPLEGIKQVFPSGNTTMNPFAKKLLEKNPGITDPRVAMSHNPLAREYRGERIRSNQSVVTDDLCINALSNLYSYGPFPVFKSFDNETESFILPQQGESYKIKNGIIVLGDVDPGKNTFSEETEKPTSFSVTEVLHYSDGTGSFVYTIPQRQGQPVTFNDINIPVNSIYFVIIVPAIPHAILAFINEAKLYTIGYGYAGEPQKSGRAHFIEVQPGAFYSADHLTPTSNQGCKIVWVGFLNEAMIRAINTSLSSVTSILYNFEENKKNKYITITNNTELRTDASYSMGSSAVPQYLRNFISKSEIDNCLSWVKRVTGAPLRCIDPQGCKGINSDDFVELLDSLRSGKSKNPAAVTDIVSQIQLKLLRIFGGKKKIKSKKIKSKSKTKVKKSNHLTKKRKPYRHRK